MFDHYNLTETTHGYGFINQSTLQHAIAVNRKRRHNNSIQTEQEWQHPVKPKPATGRAFSFINAHVVTTELPAGSVFIRQDFLTS
jgi:hypothetical protein